MANVKLVHESGRTCEVPEESADAYLQIDGWEKQKRTNSTTKDTKSD